jgi:hypothetical protein
VHLFDLPRLGGIGRHQSQRAITDSWLTPLWLIDRLGPFDLDPCAAPTPRPWSTASVHWTKHDGSLNREWSGRVWLNPPYGPPRVVGPWLRRMSEHNRGTALIFARTETALFFETVWERAAALLFFRGRITFHRADGGLPRADQGGGAAGAPSVLVAYGAGDADRLARADIAGKFIRL